MATKKLAMLLLLTAMLPACGGGGSNPGGGNPGGGSAPTAPSSLTATAGNQQVSLTWTASSGATGYNIKRGTAAGGPYTQAGTATTANYINTGLTNGTKYYFVVTATNSNGESGNSNEASATPVLPVPAAPTGLTATAGNQLVSLSWTTSAGATSYNLKKSTVSGGPYTTLASLSPTNYPDTSVTNGTPYFYVVTAVNASGESSNSNEATATPGATAADVTITVDPTKTKNISPLIYGLNFYTGVTGAPPRLTLDRAGGNRWTAYNWENNASNAGSDWGPYSNDNYLSSSSVPGEAVRSFIAADQGLGMASLMTVQLQGLVSADESGLVSVASPPDMTRFKTVVDAKGSAFTLTPSTTDAFVYMDEFLWALDQKFPGKSIFGASPAQPTFVSLDNEPELWNSTHLEVQGSTPVTSDNYITKTINLTKALKNQFPDVQITGPVHYGFGGIYNWQGELSTTPDGANWFADKYLPALKTASDSYGKPLVDIYDFHWYSEATDGSTRVTTMTGSSLTAAQVQAIVQSPRSLWDPTFTENSWITNAVLSEPIRLLPRLQSKIDTYFPGMKIAITEYDNGGDNHIAGTIAQADNLGIFGSQGVYAATMWPLGTCPYIMAGFRAFRGFDGASADFGDVSLQATSSKVQNVVAYVSLDSNTPGRVVIVAINRSTSSQVTTITGQTLSGTATLYQMTATSAQGQSPVHPVMAGTMAASGTTLTVTLPALSVTTIDVH